ncbi:Ethanolamine kinase [Sergentomyia squamirostris]
MDLERNHVQTEVPAIPITVLEEALFEGARGILSHIRPLWKPEDIEFKLFTDGITNKLVGCFHGEVTDTVLIRIYGNKTDLLIDRTAETRNIKLLHSRGFAPSLYATFNNGLAYEFVPGATLTPTSVKDDQIWPLIAQRMAEMHRVDCGKGVPRTPVLRTKFHQFLALIPEKFSNDKIHNRVKDQFLPPSKLKKEAQELCDYLEKLNNPVVFAHNDLLLGNVIYTETEQRVTFIDYEYAAYNYQAFDIGNHFNEFVGIDEIDYSIYPSRDFQMKWLRVYLETFSHPQTISQSDLNRLYVQVNKFALASHLFWTVWSLIQAEHSTIDFDFVQYAEIRYEEYLRTKNEFLELSIED